jgi:hypothetical protein
MPPACCARRIDSSYVSSLQELWAANWLDVWFDVWFDSLSQAIFRRDGASLALLLFSSVGFSLRLKYHAEPSRIQLPP